MPWVCVCAICLSIYLSICLSIDLSIYIYICIHTYIQYIHIHSCTDSWPRKHHPTNQGLPSSYPIFTAFPSEVHSSRGIDPRGQSYLDWLLVSIPWKTSIFVKSSSQISRKMVSTLETANHWIELVDPNNLWEKLSCLIWSANDSEMIAQSKYFER